MKKTLLNSFKPFLALQDLTTEKHILNANSTVQIKNLAECDGILKGASRIRCSSPKPIHFSSHRWVFFLQSRNNVIYVENTYLHSHFLHAPCTRNSIHIYARIIIYGVDMQWFCSLHRLHPVVKLPHFSSHSWRAVNISLRAFKIHFLAGRSARDTIEVDITHSDQTLILSRLHHSTKPEAREKRGEKKNRLANKKGRKRRKRNQIIFE